MSAFRHGLGHVTLDFVATLGDRTGRRIERLAKPEDLSCWLEETGLAERAPADALLLDEARALREAIYRLLTRTRNAERPAKADLELVNEWARRPTLAPQINRNLRRSLIGPDPAAGALAQLARESIELVSGPDLARVRRCAGCSLLFLDRSRPGRRRWCSMESCGNRDKSARYRHKTLRD